MRGLLWSVVLCVSRIHFACGGETIVSNKELAFEIKFPDGWTVTEKTPEGWAVKGVSRVADGAKTVAIVKVLVSEAGENVSAMSLGESLNTQLQKKLVNYELIDKSEVKMGYAAGYKVTYAYDGTNSKERVQGVVYFVLQNKRAYQITTTANRADYSKYGAEIDKIVASFKPKAAE
jgi:hypothetical protein